MCDHIYRSLLNHITYIKIKYYKNSRFNPFILFYNYKLIYYLMKFSIIGVIENMSEIIANIYRTPD